MTAATLRARPSRAPAPAGLARLWIEIKRNAVPWVLPLLAVLFFFDTYRTTAGSPRSGPFAPRSSRTGC